MKMKTIFDSTSLGALTLKNRIWRSATWMALSPDGKVSDELVEVYREYARGQVAAIITGLTSISPYDEDLYGGVKFWDDSDLEGHRKLTDAIHAEGSLIYMQTAMVDGDVNGWPLERLQEIIGQFGNAAARAQKAGYDGVQIHAAHFFFLSKFISPAMNQRTDMYGGSQENRSRMLVDILKDMRSKTGADFSIIVKVNASDFVPGGLDMEGFLTTCQMLSAAGIDAIEISANGTSVPGIRAGKNEAYFREYAEALKQVVDTPVILVGGHRSIEAMNTLINETGIEYLSMSRPLIREPHLVKRWIDGDTRPALCVSCNSCYRTPGHACVFKLRGM